MGRLTMAMCALALLVMTVRGTPAAEAEKKLLGHWRFDDGSGMMAQDSSGNGKFGVLLKQGQRTKWVDGRKGKAIEFVGGDPTKKSDAGGVTIPQLGSYDYSKGLTTELWVKFTQLPSGTCELVTNTELEHGKGWRLNVSQGRFNFTSGPGGEATKSWGVVKAEPKVKLKTGVWYHVAATYDGSVFRVYLNGKQIGASKAGLAMTKGRTNLTIGSYNLGYAYGLNGIVDDVKVYNYARSADEILAAAKATQ